MPTQAFKIQRGTVNMTGTLSNLFAGVDYTSPISATSAFVRITNARLTGAGPTTGGTQENLNCFTAYVTGASDLTSGFSLVRNNSADDTDITWEIVEYVGGAGGANEFIVRTAEGITGTAVTLTGTTLTTVVDAADCVVFITGQSTEAADRNSWADALWTSSLVANGGDWDPTIVRGNTQTATTCGASVAVVEFTGSNWTVTREEFTTTATDWTTSATNNNTTYTLGTSIASKLKTFLHVQMRSSHDPTGLNDAGDNVELNNTTLLTVRNRVSTGTKTKVAWVVQNSQADGTARNMATEQIAAYWTTGSDPSTSSQTLTITVDAMDETSIMGECCSCDGGGTTMPRGNPNVRLTSTSNVDFWRADGGQELRISAIVVQWPEDPDAAGPSTKCYIINSD